MFTGELVNQLNSKAMGLLLASGSSKPQYPYDMWYGVQGDFTSRDRHLTRVGNLDLHRTLPIQQKLRRFVENEDGSVKYYLGQNDSRKRDSGAAAILDSTDGNVMLEKPEYYFRMEFEGTKWLRAYSEYPLPGFIKMERKAISPWFGTYDQTLQKPVSGCWLTWDGNDIARDGNGLPVFTENAARFRGGNGSASYDGTYRSFVGMARTSVNKATVRGWCNAAGNGIHHGAYRVYNEIAWLQRVEYASMDCQDTYTTTLTADGFHQGGLGNGCTVAGGEWNTHNGYNPFVPCGVTATLGNNTGKVSYVIKNWANSGNDKTVQVTSYRGLEVPFEYLWMLADDVLIWHKEDVSEAYVCEDPTKFTSHSDSATTVPAGYELASELPMASGYGLTMSHNHKGYSFIDKVGGAANEGVCDYYYYPSPSGWYGALLSALAADGAFAGFGGLSANCRSSAASASLGFRLCRG